MQNYLSGYLEVLPEFQRRKIEEIVKGNQSLFNVSDVTEEEFKEIIDRLAEDHEQLTKFTPQIDKLDADLYNAFFSNVHVDMNLMYLESQMIESASANYSRIFDGILDDLNKEMKALRERSNSLRLVSEGEDGLIVKSYSFNDKSQMETNREENEHLFQDRDGTVIPDAEIERNHDQNYLCLGKRKTLDCLRGPSGKVTAKIEEVDRRGIPVKGSKYKIENAIDGSNDTYWASVVLTDEPINMKMKK